MDFLQNIAAFVFVLGVMVLVHELGHFLAARYFDVRVEAFSFGFGPRLFGVKRGGTDYKVCLFPLGGYVKMAGEQLGTPTGDPDEFVAKPRWQRIIIALMGPAFNGVLAVALLAGLFMVKYQRFAIEQEPALIGYAEEGMPAAEAGILDGDTIVAIDGEPTPNWESVRSVEITSANKTILVTVERDGRRRDASVAVGANENTGAGDAGWSAIAPVKLSLDPNFRDSPASAAGVQDGDILLTVQGVEIKAVPQVSPLVQQLGGVPIEVELLRDGQVVLLTVTPVRTTNERDGTRWRIGVGLSPNYERIVTQLGPVEAFRESWRQNMRGASLIFRFLGGLFERRMSPKSLEGPIGIARLSGRAARSSLSDLIMLMSMISLNLGIFNLLPIPILDGGVITLLLLESVMRRDLSLQVKERFIQVGLVFLVLLFAFVMYNDIVKSLTSG